MQSNNALIVDDDASICDLISKCALRAGLRPTVVYSSRAFKEAHDEVSPAVITIDVVMPDEDGIELLQWLAARDCRARILIVSGYDPLYSHAAFNIGKVRGLDVIAVPKPFSVEDLVSKMSSAISVPTRSPVAC